MIILVLLTLIAVCYGRDCPDSSYTICADEGSVCDIAGSNKEGFLSYGSNGKYVLIPWSNSGGSELSIECDSDHGDINPGAAKVCCYKSTKNHFDVAWEGNLPEGSNWYDFPDNAAFYSMRYGANGKYIYRVVEGSVFYCNNQWFNDPVFGIGKHCQWSYSNPPELDLGHYQWVYCGAEGGVCSGLSSAATWVAYGNNGNFAYRYVISQEDGTIPCSNGFFEDSLPGTGKHCWRATCGRHRRPWLEMDQTDRNLYINGFKELNAAGITQKFSESHGNKAPSYHGYAAFLPYHRGLIYKMEDAIRALGGEYYCFSMPYWEQSHPSARDTLLSSGLDGTSSSGCLTGTFTSGYTPYRDNCLYRNAGTNSYTSASTLMDMVDNYATFDEFWPRLENAPHGSPHVYLGGWISSISKRGHMGDFYYSPDDPIFYLHHCFVDYIWALWQDCSNFDGQSPVTNAHYPLGNLNYELEYDPITDDTIRSGDLLDLYPYGVSYEKGGFWGRAQVDSTSNCGAASNPINDDWFRSDGRRRMVNNNDNDPQFAECDAIFDTLKERYGDDEHTLMHEWAVQDCKCRQRISNTVCELPSDYDDCTSMQQNGHFDIDITLDELLNKRGINDCMKKTRRAFYKWAEQTHTLLELCIGCYDPFCDTTSIDPKCEGAAAGHQDDSHNSGNAAFIPKNSKPIIKPQDKPIMEPGNNIYYDPELYPIPPPRQQPVSGGYYIYITSSNMIIIFGLIVLFITCFCVVVIQKINYETFNKKPRYKVVKFENSSTDDEENLML